MQELYLFILKILPMLLSGAEVTIKLSVLSLAIGFASGVPLALLRQYAKGVLRWAALAYIEIIRGTPLLVQILLIWYGLPELGLTRFWAAVLALGANSAAYQAEYLRSAIESINPSQIMAARSLGMSMTGAIRYIVLPQALRLALPALGNEVAYMLKYTSIAFVIAVPELMARGRMAISWYFKPAETWFCVALIYVLLVNLTAWLMQSVEKKWRIPGFESHRES